MYFLLKTRPRPKTKLPKLVEIVPDMYPDVLFGDMSWKPLEISKKVGFSTKHLCAGQKSTRVQKEKKKLRVTILTLSLSEQMPK